ncbi:MAG: Calx-beta domain-containing protein [Cyanobacteria bacterium P01_E01_bin.6]
MAVLPINDEFRVNRAIPEDQSVSDITVDADGSFITTWNTNSDTFMRRVAFNGVPQGIDIPISGVRATSPARFFSPAIATTANGGFIVAQIEQIKRSETPVVFSTLINVGSYDAQHNRLKSVLIPALSPNHQLTQPEVVVTNEQGNYAVVWRSTNFISGSDIFAQRFDAQHEPIDIEPFRVETFDTGNQFSPAIASDHNGGFIITWAGQGLEDEDGIYARHFYADGSSNEFLVNSSIEDAQYQSAIAVNKNGDYVISWTSYNEDKDDDDIFARQFNGNDVPKRKEFLVNNSTLDTQENSAVAIAPDGSFVIAWESYEQDSDSDGIFAKRFRADGTPDGREFPVNSFTKGTQQSPVIAINDDHEFLIAWSSTGQDSDGSTGIYAQQYSVFSEIGFSQPSYQIRENGTPVGTPVIFNRSDRGNETFKLDVSIVGGTATAGVDYNSPLSIPVTFNPGEMSKVINIPILQDNQIEGTESIVLELTDSFRPTNRHKTVIQILDDDSPRGSNSGNNSLIQGTNGNDRLTGTNAGETLVGLKGNDAIRAKGGDDILVGVNPESRRPGKNERDKLMGNGGNDLFVLGDEDNVFYDDGRRRSAGLKDFALIKGFNKRQDTIQLHGDKSNYVLGSAPKGKGVGLFLEGREDELIAVIRGRTNNLRFNSSAFIFI